MSETPYTWQQAAEEGKRKIEKAISILNHKMELMLPTPDTIQEYAQMQHAKKALQAAIQAMKPIQFP